MKENKAKNIEAIYPLSPMQQGMLFHSVFNEGVGEYFEQFFCTIHGDLNEDAFARALSTIIQRHSSLRTAFVWKKVAKMLQVVHKEVELPLHKLDWSALPPEEQKQKFAELLQTDRQRGFNLARAPLMRFYIIRLGFSEVKLYWAFHHLLTDGWSMPIVLKEVFTLYEAYSINLPVQLPPARPYSHYIDWIQRQSLENAELFWKKIIGDFSAPVCVLEDRIRDEEIAEQADYVKLSREFSVDFSRRLFAFARQNQLTVNTLVQGAWALLLARLTNETDIVFGATVSGRPPELPEVEKMVGLFINTLPIRVWVDDQKTGLTFLQDVQKLAVEMRDYEYTPLVDIHGWSRVPRNMPLFNSIVVFENYPVDASMQNQVTSLQFSDFHTIERVNYPMSLVAGFSDRLVLDIAYETKKYRHDTVERYLSMLERILYTFVDRASEPLAHIKLLNPAEEKKIVADWNRTGKAFDKTICLHQLFENWVERQPRRIALKFKETRLTYRGLNNRANQLAHYLREKGICPEDRVAIYLERSIEMIVAILAIQKAGGAYVPIDPGYPAERVNYILEDSAAKLLLSHASLLSSIDNNIQAIDLFGLAAEIKNEPTANPENVTLPENLAYMIYTSGSTGRPKGTLLQHRGAINMVQTLGERFYIHTKSRVLQFASLAFDGSVAEIYMALCNGATLYLVERETILSLDKLHQLLHEEAISTVTLPPSLLAVLDHQDLSRLSVVVSAGEAVTPDIVRRWAPGRTYINGYGPTENTVAASSYEAPREKLPTGSVPIGRPFANMQLYILNKYLEPVPIGVPGELCIAGSGLARGYLHRPDLTAEKFIPNPFSDFPGERMYRSGDLTRYTSEGNIEFLGRIDFQVKIRGFRIELGEIEAVLSHHDNVRDAVVLAKEDANGQTMLIGYVIPQQGSAIDQSQLQSFVRDQLPDYMVPSIILTLESFPLTSSGKVDRRALPEPDMEAFAKSREYVAPRNETETQLAAIWQDILSLDRVGVTDSFFDLGGHSLMATQLVSRIRDAFGVELPLRDIFETPTIASLTLLVEQARLREQNVAPPIEKADRTGDIPLSFSQKRLWFLDQLAPNNAFYNIPGAIKLSGHLNIEAFEKSITEITRRHEALRTTFAATKGKPRQIIHDDFPGDIEKIDLSDVPQDEQDNRAKRKATEEAQKPFNLEQGPLFRIKLLKMNDREHVVVFNMHHTIADGWSVGVLVNEFAQLYTAFSQDQPSPLEELPIQYADYAVWQHNWLQGDVLDKQLNFWKETIGLNPPVLELPTDRPRPVMQTFVGANVRSILPKSLADRIRTFCQKEGVTPFMFLLAAFQTMLHRYSGQNEILVGSPIANRTSSQTEKLIGFFVNTLVLKANFSRDMDFRSLLRQVRDMTLNAYAHQDIPFEQLVDALQPAREMSHSPLFQVAFILQNTPLKPLNLPNITISPVEADSKTSKYDLTLNTAETDEGLFCHFEYNTDLFDRSTIERMLRHYQIIVEGILSHPTCPVSELPLLSNDEIQRVIYAWNNTAVDYPDNHTVHQLFAEWVLRQPEAEAARCGSEFLSYAELNRRANQLAHYLVNKGIRVDDIVGLCLERSLNVPVAILGILKAGAGFLNIDPTYPEDRKAYMIEDSAIAVLLTQAAIAETLPKNSATHLCLDSEWDKIAALPNTAPHVVVSPENLSYVIYTSGSTGKPKGTLLPHRGLCNLFRAQRAAFHIEAGHRVLQFAPLSFDASVWETVMALLNGACLVYAPQENLTTGQGLRDVIKEQQVNIVTLPPSVLSVMPRDELFSLKTIVTAGEACSLELVKQWGVGRQYVNAYGPTETTVCASYYETHENDSKAPPIGKPLQNFQLYILDKYWSHVPIGVPGELCVGGVGLARGYLHRPDLTADKFIPNPYSSKPGERLYRTGDLVRYLPDGNIEFLGRIDFQVKVRGFRIELGEIEAVLSKQPGVTDVIVLVREDTPGDLRIVAYIVAKQDSSPADLKSNCRTELPDYMIPSAFVILDEFPLTPSGKIDRRALPKPEISREDLSSEFVAPRNEREKKLAAIVAQLLKVEHVGVHDNFFELGGHSLLATQFMAELEETFHIDMPLRTIFEKPTIAELATLLHSLEAAGPSTSETVEKLERGEQSIDDMLAELESLSEEEVQALLAAEENDKIR
ncbi:amino acid adenylation domain-containing protein [candidate division KSB1 bacterium]|nr:amino acid adenylation domain-containing protein [candidate division KSB1 bacterium]RQW04845.1 MAG: amino acid adenylation domain-containing protein [candidate division KSB1 bacterium]